MPLAAKPASVASEEGPRAAALIIPSPEEFANEDFLIGKTIWFRYA